MKHIETILDYAVGASAILAYIFDPELVGLTIFLWVALKGWQWFNK